MTVNNLNKKAIQKQIFMINLLKLTTVVVAFVLVANVFLVSVGKFHLNSTTDLTKYISQANLKNEKIKAKRGYIYDRNGVVVAEDVQTYDIICHLDKNRLAPKGVVAYVDDPIKTSKELAPLLGMDEMKIYELLIKDLKQTELGTAGRKLSKEEMEAIDALNLNGIEFVESIKRNYPYGEFAPYVLGFAQANDNQSSTGVMGIELYLDRQLTGIDGSKSYQSDNAGFILPGMKSEIVDAQNGDDVILTLDLSLQESLETSFEMTMERFNSDRIWGAVMEIDTGRMLAYGQSPGFDLNEKEITEYTNYGSQYPYEPGSTMKAFTYAAAIDSGAYDTNVLVDSSTYCYAVDGKGGFYRVPTNDGRKVGCINNANKKSWGMIPYDMGLVYSSNTVTASIIDKLIAPSVYEDYLEAFGFFQKTDVDGISEAIGTKNYRYPADKIALSYGQGSTVTMLQLMQGYSAIFGDGQMVKPYFIEQIVDPYDDQDIKYQAQTTIVNDPITQETAQQMQDILYQVIYDEKGTGRFYKIDETQIIGKTGTTQVASLSGAGYNSGKTIASVMLALPYDDPKYMIYYAFEGDYDKNAHFNTEAINQLTRKVAQLYNLTDNINSAQENENDEVIDIKITDEIMPNLVNHTLEYSLKKTEELNLDVVIIGNGTQVLSQMPIADSNIKTNEKVFILTDNSNIMMPNMLGWTRSDVTKFWSLTNIAVKMDGYGKVTSQNITENSLISKNDEIELILE